MRKLHFKLWSVVLPMLLAAFAAGCNTEDVDPLVPELGISATPGGEESPSLTLDFDKSEGTQTFYINSNRHWTVTSDEGWAVVSPESGDGSGEVTVQVTSNAGVGRIATLTVSSVLFTRTVTVSQAGEGGALSLIYADNLDGAPAVQTDNKWPFVDQFDGWNITGEGAKEVTYSGSNASVRNNSNSKDYPGASGVNNIYLGGAGAYFQINKIRLEAGQTNLQFTFGIVRSEYNNYDAPFNPSEFTLELSADGTQWTPITYQRSDKSTWDLATADFTLSKPTEFLYVKITAKAVPGRLDDFKLMTGNGGQTVDLEGGVTPPEPDQAIYSDNLDKEPAVQTGNKWPFVDQFTGWNPTGEGAGDVSYSGQNATVRNNSNSKDYTGASGVNNIYLGGAGAYFQINKIKLSAAQTNLRFTFGIVRSEYNNYDAPFNPSEFTLELSADGTTWTPITYQRSDKATWDLATADFTLSKPTEFLYVKITAKAVPGRLDDFSLTTGQGGQTVDLEGGVTPPDPGQAIYADNLDKEPAVQTGNKWPFVDQFTGWNPTGEGAGDVSYSGQNATVRNNSNSKDYTGASGVNNIYLGGAGAYFQINKIKLTAAQTDLRLSFGIVRSEYGNYDAPFVASEFTLSLSGDGTNWVPVTYERSASATWALATSDFTLAAASEYLYVKITANAVAGRLDDFSLSTGEGGQSVDLGGGDTPPGPGGPELLDPVVAFTDDFAGIVDKAVYESPSWYFTSSAASWPATIYNGWHGRTFNNSSTGQTDKYLAIAPSSSTEPSVTAYAVILAPFDVAGATDKTVRFDLAWYWATSGNYAVTPDNAQIEVVVSKNFTGDVDAATWTVVGSYKYTSELSTDMNVWYPKSVDLSSAYGSETALVVAFRYNNGKNITYRLDNVAFGGAAPSVLTVTTSAPREVGETTATLVGSYQGGDAAPTKVGFELTDEGGHQFDYTATLAPAFSYTATDLLPATTYTCRAYAQTAAGKVYGSSVNFTTAAPAGNVLAGWVFTNATDLNATEGNTSATISRVGVNTELKFTGSNSSIWCNGWDNGATTDKYWLLTIPVTSAVPASSTLALDWGAWGTNTSPKNWTVEYSTDNAAWTKIGDVVYENKNKATHSLSAALPSGLPAGTLYIRFKVADNTSIATSDTTGDVVQEGGNSRMANITVAYR